METYHIHCTPGEQDSIKDILRRYHDVIINLADDNHISITIERDKDEAEAYYHLLLERINRELHLAIH